MRQNLVFVCLFVYFSVCSRTKHDKQKLRIQCLENISIQDKLYNSKFGLHRRQQTAAEEKTSSHNYFVEHKTKKNQKQQNKNKM